jgi:hypothetical protein
MPIKLFKPTPRADYWAYAAIFAIQRSVANANANCATASCVVPDPGIDFLKQKHHKTKVSMKQTKKILVRFLNKLKLDLFRETKK